MRLFFLPSGSEGFGTVFIETAAWVACLHLPWSLARSSDVGIGVGNKVIVPDSTWVGNVFPITWTGATPVFVDIPKDTLCPAPAKVEASITPRTKEIIAVHLYGLCVIWTLL